MDLTSINKTRNDEQLREIYAKITIVCDIRFNVLEVLVKSLALHDLSCPEFPRKKFAFFFWRKFLQKLIV